MMVRQEATEPIVVPLQEQEITVMVTEVLDLRCDHQQVEVREVISLLQELPLEEVHILDPVALLETVVIVVQAEVQEALDTEVPVQVVAIEVLVPVVLEVSGVPVDLQAVGHQEEEAEAEDETKVEKINFTT
ncbi:hypothetical protein MTsPCn5_28240 [Croceitalea sp. MTPC5]|nr:hypothetical protein MTsPCn5_28240 [Croceitalea sp. MTPC5]